MSIFHQPWELVPNHIRGKGGREIDKFRGVYPPVDYDAGSEAWIGSVTHVQNAPAAHQELQKLRLKFRKTADTQQ